MTTLAPTVHERLARCGTRVFVDGLVTGAAVELDVGGAIITHTATGGAHTFVVPSLVANTIVRVRQDEGAGPTPWSPPVTVEDALVPPQSVPFLPPQVGVCSECVLVTHLVPDSTVRLWVGVDLVGEGRANRHGDVCVGVDLTKLRGKETAILRGRMLVCGVQGPEATTPIVLQPGLPIPVVGSPLFGCQSVVPLSNLRPGARVRMETDTGTDLGSICSCWGAVNVFVLHELVVDESVRARSYYSGKPCEEESNWSDWQLVVKPDEQIKPKILEPLYEGDQIIRVENQIQGATLLIRIAPAEGQPYEEFGPRPASVEQEVGLNAPLIGGNVATVVQSLCGVAFESDPVTVLPPPPFVPAPVIIPPLYACGTSVQVSGLVPGATVRVFADSIPIGVAWAGDAVSVKVSVAPTLIAGTKVTATQKVGSVTSVESEGVEVQPLPRVLQTPRILPPVALGDTGIWVTRVTPGAHITIHSGGVIIGSLEASEPIVRVPVSPVDSAVSPRIRICNRTRAGVTVEPIKSPCAAGDFKHTGDEFREYDKWTVPATADGDVLDTRIEGQIYFPATSGGKLNPKARNLPLVVIAHGYWDPDIFSYTGYDYLARHLARWGMIVLSINMDDVNNATSVPITHQYTRGEIILRAIDEVLADNKYGKAIDPTRIGLIGHSMGGEGVVAAQFLNETEGRGYNIRGVVSIAPTHWRPELILRQTRYMQLLGSYDQLTSAMTGTDAQAHFSGFRIYDRAWRPKTHFWIYGARHNPFNTVWVANGDNYETHLADIALPPQDHERIARCLINAFFQDALLNRAEYAGYMQGTILPESLKTLEIHSQYSNPSRVAVDNFGDPDEQVPLAAVPLDKTDNSLGLVVDASGSGLGLWQDVEHTSLTSSPHNTKGVELSWTLPDAQFDSDTGGVSRPVTDVIALRIGQFYEDGALNPVAQPVDLFVTLSDGTDEATVRLGAVAAVPYPDAAPNVLAPMRTVRIPLDAFKAVNPALTTTALQRVTCRLIGRATGHILLDDIEIGS